MRGKHKRIHIGLRTIKSAAAVIISMVIVNSYGASTSKLIFAMMGAMAAMEPSFKESLESCFTQIVGMFFGALAGVFLLALPLPSLLAAGIGIVFVITFYNSLHIRFSPSLPCLIVVTLCTTPDIQPLTYAIGRFWDTAIGLSVGMLINTLVFPYDNSQKIRSAAESLDKEVIFFLEKMFDSNNTHPDTKKIYLIIDDMDRQLKIFSKQSLLLHRKKHRQLLETFQICEKKAKQLMAQMEVLCRMDCVGRLSDENISLLKDYGAKIEEDSNPEMPKFTPGESMPETTTELDIVTNYHVTQILILRQDLINILKNGASH